MWASAMAARPQQRLPVLRQGSGVTMEPTYRCDAEGCERHVIGPRTNPFLTVIDTTIDEPLHFCGWSCLLKHAATFPPEEVIEL